MFFEDMFTPGLESLGYILDQVPDKYKPQIYVRCLAQTIDPDDFTNSIGMFAWMSKFEQMINNIQNIHILATNEEMVANMKIAGWTAPVYNISGLSFNKKEVQTRAGVIPKFNKRPVRVSFASRWDLEKQPEFLLDIFRNYKNHYSLYQNVEFCILSGGKLKSNSKRCLELAKETEKDNLITIHDNLSKEQYYNYLKNSRVLILTSLQDWVSNSIMEADALGCNVLAPAYRSFPETLSNDKDRLYIPWSIDDASEKLFRLTTNPHKNIRKLS